MNSFLKAGGIDVVITYIVNNYMEPITLGELATFGKIPENTLTRRFNRLFGTSPIRWIWVYRTFLAAQFIQSNPRQSLTTVALRCGFSSSAHFSRRFKEILGLSPSAYRRRFQRGLMLGYESTLTISTCEQRALNKVLETNLRQLQVTVIPENTEQTCGQ